MAIIGQTNETTTTVFKLVSGEEIIATTRMVPSEAFGQRMLVSKARMLALQPGPGGQVGIAMIPWVISAGDSEYELSPSAVIVQLSERQISAKLLTEYTRQITGLELASAADLTTLQGK